VSFISDFLVRNQIPHLGRYMEQPEEKGGGSELLLEVHSYIKHMHELISGSSPEKHPKMAAVDLAVGSFFGHFLDYSEQQFSERFNRTIEDVLS